MMMMMIVMMMIMMMMIVMMMLLTSHVTRGPPLSPWQESLPSPPAQIIWSVMVPGLYRVAVVQPALDLGTEIVVMNDFILKVIL